MNAIKLFIRVYLNIRIYKRHNLLLLSITIKTISMFHLQLSYDHVPMKQNLNVSSQVKYSNSVQTLNIV